MGSQSAGTRVRMVADILPQVYDHDRNGTREPQFIAAFRDSRVPVDSAELRHDEHSDRHAEASGSTVSPTRPRR